jgi:hypothetical protein
MACRATSRYVVRQPAQSRLQQRTRQPTIQKWFDTSCFVAPATGVLGWHAHDPVGAGALECHYAISKVRQVPVPAEIFNVFNTRSSRHRAQSSARRRSA